MGEGETIITLGTLDRGQRQSRWLLGAGTRPSEVLQLRRQRRRAVDGHVVVLRASMQ